eukprot:gene4619-5226_t
MAIPSAVLATGWIPFVVILVLAFLFAWSYVRIYQHHEMSELSSTLMAILALFVTLLISGLVPVDVFLVTYMKTSDGEFKSWAKDPASRKSIEDTITYTYYVLYAVAAFFLFLVLPFMYFFYEEREDEISCGSRCCTAFKYTVVFLFLALIVLLVGAFVPLRSPPKNMTDIGDKFKFLKSELAIYSNGEQCISVLIGVLSIFGMTLIFIYTEEENTRGLTTRERNEERTRMLRAKANSGRTLTRWERNQLRRLEEDERLRRRVDRLKKGSTGCCGKIALALAPFRFLFGILFLLLSLLIVISMLITSIDKMKHSLGYKYGYALPKPTITNPLNFIMVYAQKVFPLDYILFAGIVLFLLFASMCGLKRMGIWCCFVRMYKVRAFKTMPQGLLMMIFMLMLMVLATNVMLFTIAPQYVTFGSQHYQVNKTVSGSSINATDTYTFVKEVCSTESPPDQCIMSRMAMLLNKLFYKAWFFGAFFYYAQWCFIGVFFLGFVVSLIKCRMRKSSFDEDDLESDEEELATA